MNTDSAYSTSSLGIGSYLIPDSCATSFVDNSKQDDYLGKLNNSETSVSINPPFTSDIIVKSRPADVYIKKLPIYVNVWSPSQKIDIDNNTLILPTTINVIDSKKKFPFIDSSDFDRLNTMEVSAKCYDNSCSTYFNQAGIALSFRPTRVKSLEDMNFGLRDTIKVLGDIEKQYLLCSETDVKVINGERTIIGDILRIDPVTVVVSDYKPPDIGGNTGGDGVNFIRIIAQKNSYCEVFLEFKERKIISAEGLPPGLFVEKGVIKGCATISGKFIVSIVLDNDSKLEALIIVPELPRKL